MNMRTNIAKDAALTATDMKAVIDVGAPSYASGVHWWNGAAAILKNMPADSVTIAITEMGSVTGRRDSASAISTNRVEPDNPYSSDMPYRRMPDENAPSRKYFIEASFDF